MGNTSSRDVSANSITLIHKWKPDAPWRSNRAVSLDLAHDEGLKRPPLKLGESFTYRKAAEDAKNAKPPRIKVVGMRFHTDARVVEREAVEAWRVEEHRKSLQGTPTSLDGPQREPRVDASSLVGQEVAPWRLRVHAARRRALLKVLVLVRLILLARLPKNRPLRDMTGYFIPLALRDDLAPFARVQRLFLGTQREVEVLRAALEEAKAAAGTLSGAVAPAAISLRSSTSTPNGPGSGRAARDLLLASRGSLDSGSNSPMALRGTRTSFTGEGASRGRSSYTGDGGSLPGSGTLLPGTLSLLQRRGSVSQSGELSEVDGVALVGEGGGAPVSGRLGQSNLGMRRPSLTGEQAGSKGLTLNRNLSSSGSITRATVPGPGALGAQTFVPRQPLSGSFGRTQSEAGAVPAVFVQAGGGSADKGLWGSVLGGVMGEVRNRRASGPGGAGTLPLPPAVVPGAMDPPGSFSLEDDDASKWLSQLQGSPAKLSGSPLKLGSGVADGTLRARRPQSLSTNSPSLPLLPRIKAVGPVSTGASGSPLSSVVTPGSGKGDASGSPMLMNSAPPRDRRATYNGDPDGTSPTTLTSRLSQLRSKLEVDTASSAGELFIAQAERRRQSGKVEATVPTLGAPMPGVPVPPPGPSPAAITRRSLTTQGMGSLSNSGSGGGVGSGGLRDDAAADVVRSGDAPSAPPMGTRLAALVQRRRRDSSGVGAAGEDGSEGDGSRWQLGMDSNALWAAALGLAGSPDDAVQPENLEYIASEKVASTRELTGQQRVAVMSRLVADAEGRLAITGAALEVALSKANSEWADRRAWKAPTVDDTPCRPAWPESEQAGTYSAEAIRMVASGKVAVQLMADEDWLDFSGTGGMMADADAADLWTCDPQLVAASVQPQALLDGPPSVTARASATGSGTTGLRVRGAIGAAEPQVQAAGEAVSKVPVAGGLSYGTRALLALVSAVERLTGGPEAVGNLSVVLHVTDAQRSQVLADIQEHGGGVYARLRGKLLLVQHTRHHGYAYSAQHHRFVPDPDSPLLPVGTGYSLMQLGWGGEALCVREDGELGVVAAPVLEVLRSRGVEWMVSWRARDASLITGEWCGSGGSHSAPSPSGGGGLMGEGMAASASLAAHPHRGPLDPLMLGYCLWMRDTQRANAMLQAVKVHTWAVASAFDSVLLEPAPRSLRDKLRGLAAGGGSSALLGADTVGVDDVVEQILNIRQKHKADTLVRVSELRVSELGSDRMASAVAGAQEEGFNTLSVGVGRYTFHLGSLAGLVMSAVGFRPKLTLRDGLLRCALDVSDLTSHVRCRLVAVHARELPQLLRVPGDLATPAMLEAMAAQDAALMAAEARHAAARHVYKPLRVRRQVPHVVVVLVVDNTVSDTACAAAAVLLRPGLDRVHIVHIAAPGMPPGGGTAAAALLQRTGDVVRRRGVDPVATCVVREEGQGLMEAVSSVVKGVGATLLVVGSTLAMEAGSSRGGPGGESFSLLLLRRLGMPMLLVTPHCRIPPVLYEPPAATPAPGSVAGPRARIPGARNLRLMVSVEPYARPLMHYLCSLLSPLQRGDRLLLGQVAPPTGAPAALASSMRVLADKFREIAQSHDILDAVHTPLEAPLPRALVAATRSEQQNGLGVHMLAVQLPSTAALAAATQAARNRQTGSAAGGLAALGAAGRRLGPGQAEAPLVLGASKAQRMGLPPHLLSVLQGAGVPLLVFPDRHVDLGLSSAPGHEHVLVKLSVTGSLHY